MKVRVNHPEKIETDLQQLNARLAAGDSRTQIMTGQPVTTRKLLDIGKHLADLEAELAQIAKEKTRLRK
jgi:hypothetical protein